MSSPNLVICEQINSELLDGVKYLWENSLFFDFTLKVEEESIPVHKVILAACSGYFRAMFNSSMKESTQTSVELKGLTANAVKSVIHYICTGIIQFPADTLEDVLSAAHYLQIHSIVDFCSDILLKDMTWESVSYVQNFARLYGLDDVEKKVEQFMLKNFSQMPSEVVGAIGNQVFKLIASNSLFVNSEYVIFEKLMLFKPTLSEDEFYEALSQVRFPLMSKSELKKVSKTGVMTTRLSHLMDEAWEYHKDVMRQPLLQTERTQVRSDKVSMIMADFYSITGVEEDHPYEKVILKMYPSDIVSDYSGIQQIAALDNFLYVCEKVDVPEGAVSPGYFSFSRYDPRFNVWQELDPLSERFRRDFPLVAFGKQIFAIGGDHNKSMEIYDIETNEWCSGSDINYDNMLSEAVALDGKIYVCGGAQYDHTGCWAVPVDIVSCYDPVNDTWQIKEPMNECRIYHQIVPFDGKVIVFGGYYNKECNDLLNVEYYSPDVDQWTLFHKALPYDIDGVCTNGSDIFILKCDEQTKKAGKQLTMNVAKFYMDAGNTDEKEYNIVLPYHAKYELYTASYPYMCSTLKLPLK